MLKIDYGGGYPCNWVRLCDSCRSSASTLYCHTDSAYLCSSCDGQIHASRSPGWPHHRVKLCGACENAPVAFICKADDASLCVNCDFEIHSANPIASRHNRVPVSPLSHILNDNEATPDDQPNYDVVVDDSNNKNSMSSKEMEEREADSWLLLGSADTIDSQVDDGFMFGETEDNLQAYGGLVEECDSSTKFENFQEDRDQGQQAYSFSEEMNESDGVVPVQSAEAQPKQLQPQQMQNIYFNMEQKPSRSVAFTNYASNCRSVAVPYMDAQMLQRGTIGDMPGYRFPQGTEIFQSASVPMQIHFEQMNRRAGVEKYREKKKSRKFEKRIRYAYRKAYAEKRPRVKGRFVKRQDVTSDEAVHLH